MPVLLSSAILVLVLVASRMGSWAVLVLGQFRQLSAPAWYTDGETPQTKGEVVESRIASVLRSLLRNIP